MRLQLITALILGLAGCGLFNKSDRLPDQDDFEETEDFYLFACDISCDTDGIDVTVDAEGAVSAQLELYLAAELIEVFDLTQLDEREWVAYPSWPAGTSFSDCGDQADFVCVIQDSAGEEIREAF